ncbi:MAG: hypothetical protein U5O15_01765 [Candidatus Krumholzibacteriota bacterium]|nr:hypothetical protein [Candidatus Krumholzibacteriota bacterium]
MITTATNYTKIEHNRRSTKQQRADFFMMNNFLYSRVENNFHTNKYFPDEDVNIYIANLLTSISNPQHHKRAGKYIIPYDFALKEFVERLPNHREKYLAYRTNADFLLISIGIFDNPKRMRPNSNPHMNLSSEGYISRCKVYYELAQSYLNKTSSRKSAMVDILGKLSRGLENYITVLSLMKTKYFNLFKKITPGEMYHFEQSVLTINRKEELAELHNKFLDAYSEYLKKKTTDQKKTLIRLVGKIAAIDPSFSFKIS